jgi:hypothetical protein
VPSQRRAPAPSKRRATSQRTASRKKVGKPASRAAGSRSAPKPPAQTTPRPASEPRTPREAWAELGELLAAALAAAHDELATRFASEIERRLQYFPKLDRNLRKALKRALEGPCETDAIVTGFGYWNETAYVSFLESLIRTWEDLTPHGGPDEWWPELEAALREEWMQNLREGMHHVEAARVFEAELAAQRNAPLTLWPMEPAGFMRYLVRAWRDAAAARMGVAKSDLLDPDLLPSEMTFRFSNAATAVTNLSAWLRDQSARSRVLALVLPLLAEIRVSQ